MKLGIIGASLLLGLELSKRVAERQPELEVVVIMPPAPEPEPHLKQRHIALLTHEVTSCCSHYDLSQEVLALREVYPDYLVSPSPEIMVLTMKEHLIDYDDSLFGLVPSKQAATFLGPKKRTSSASFDNAGWPAPCWYGATQRAVHS